MHPYFIRRKIMKRILALILCVVMCLSTAASLAGCNGDNSGDVNAKDTTADSGEGEKVVGEAADYTINVSTSGGVALDGVDVYVFADEALSDLVGYAKTNAEGVAGLSIPQSDNYYISLSGVAKGYNTEPHYTFTNNEANINLTSSLVADEDLSTATLAAGDVMYDFTVTNSQDGSEIKLSDILKEKKLVVLNFWYTTCTWCLEEFPIMNDVYRDNKEDVEIIALNPLEDNLTVKGFADQYQFEFPMAACPASWSQVFGISGYPTSVFIDRNGVICLVESGAITSKRPFICAFDHFTAEDYQQKICTSIGDLVTNVEPTYQMPESDVIKDLITDGSVPVTFRPETEDENAAYIWPFIEGNKLSQPCIYASNTGYDDTYAILYADVTLKAGEAVSVDYLVSSERYNDPLFIIVEGEDIFQISGVSETEEWKTCYPLVADKDGTYEVAFCFIKDSSTMEGDDTVYIDNFKIVDAADIDTPTYLPRYPAVYNEEDDSYTYESVVLNPEDGYYHVGTVDGPLLLADLMNYTQFMEEKVIFDIVYEGKADKDGVSLYNKVEDGGLGMVDYFSYSTNSALNGVCTVNEELASMLKQIAEVAGFTGDSDEWLKMCKYYKAYGTNGAQLDDPIRGLSTFSTFEVTLGKDVETNYFYYDRAIIPRGLLAKFVPEKSGVYRFTSKSDYEDGIDGWIFDETGVIYTFERGERMYSDPNNCSMVYYMEAGKAYYINMAFWDVYATGYIYYDVEYLGESLELFTVCSPGYFTYNPDATGEQIYEIIAGGITPVLGDDGYYHESVDGSIIYADFSGSTGVFGQSISEIINMGGFDFSKDERDDQILAYYKSNDYDVDKTLEYLKDVWGEDYDENYELYCVEDVLAGRYHGSGADYTEEMKAYLALMDESDTELYGCVPVDERLAELLQLLMNKYTFEDVKNSWIKVCFYYDYLGPEK